MPSRQRNKRPANKEGVDIAETMKPDSSYCTDDLESGLPHKVVGVPSQKAGGTSKGLLSVVVWRRVLFAVLIFAVGSIASTAFLAVGIIAEQESQGALFEQRSNAITKAIKRSFEDFELFGLWMHQSCHAPLEGNSTEEYFGHGPLGMCSRKKFREIYEYIQSLGLLVQVAQFIPLVKHEDRHLFEEEARQFYEEYHPEINYQGFIGFEAVPGTHGFSVVPQREKPLYAPLHYIEPLAGNEKAIDLNLLTHPAQGPSILTAIQTWKPTVTERIKLVQDSHEADAAYSVALRHPGVPTSSVDPGQKPTNLANMAIRVRAILERAGTSTSVSATVMLFDSTGSLAEDPVFLGGMDSIVDDGEIVTFVSKSETTLHQFAKNKQHFKQSELKIADRTWIVAVASLEGTFEAEIMLVIFGGFMIVMAFLLLSTCFYTHMGRTAKRIQSANEAEKAAIVLETEANIILETAQQQARNERQLNDFIAHEVRNPLSSAIAALSFISAAVNGPLTDPAKLQAVKEDIVICDSSLQFINDLLRNMLDMHRAASNQLEVAESLTDIENDILQPVAAILYIRNSNIQLSVDCPPDMVVSTDSLRLKQVVLNLVMNASKFVTQGYIRVGALVANGSVQIFVEDSGPGIPNNKREYLFEKFQESLDVLSQGTGIGLSLCKNLADLLGCSIWLDESFRSGVEGCPGTRFVIDLNRPPETIRTDDYVESKGVGQDGRDNEKKNSELMVATHEEDTQAFLREKNGCVISSEEPPSLPETLSVLFVDDDMIVRKLFSRSVRRLAPSWSIKEAANGEAALRLVDTEKFDLIFMDQYMASVEKQLLGTETVRALRAKGIDCRICGLSANDVEAEFFNVGADKFLFKPFPVKPDALKNKMFDVLYGSSDASATIVQNGTAVIASAAIVPKVTRTKEQQ